MIDIKTDSRLVKKGDTFVALRGVNVDGHEFIDKAILNGASKIVAEYGEYSVPTIIVKDTKEYLEKYLKEKYYNEIKDLKLIGVTGTNGKTTTCFLIYNALNMLNKKCAYIGTIGFYLEDKVCDLNNTTPGLLETYNLLLEAKEKEFKYVAMEVSSHALAMDRLVGLEFDIALFTNLTKDHLDYHKTFDAYALSKQILFKMLRGNKDAIINSDADYKDMMLLDINNNTTYGFKEGDYHILNYEMNHLETKFTYKYNNQLYNITTPLLGKHNIYNLLTTIIVLNKLGVDQNKIEEIISNLHAPKGRMDKVNYKTNSIIVDYAHTPDAVYNIISAVLEFTKGNVYTTIGCGGNRDKTKRPEMAKIATDLSTLALITSDNPRLEDPNDIISDMLNGLENTNYEIIVDRKKAIKRGIELLNDNDVLLILGKGHEDYQIIGTTKIHFDDKETVLEIIGGK